MRSIHLSLFAILLLILFCSCSNKTIPALSPEQKTTIEEEVNAQYNKYLSALNQNDYELWAGFFSEDNFVSVLAYPLVEPTDYKTWMIEVKDSFSRRIKHETELIEIKITALAPDIAISTQFGKWKTHWTDMDYTNIIYHASFLWKKEADGWKIIHVNETGFPKFE